MFPKLTLFQFDRIEKILEKKAGFRYDVRNRFVLEKRLHRVLSENRIGIDSYLCRLSEDQKLLAQLIEKVTINETYFFRENSSLQAMAKIVKEKITFEDQKINILCAGCATGEEGYSIAIYLAEAGIPQHMVNIECFDISLNAIKRAREGCYRGRAVRELKSNIREKYFIQNKDFIKVKPFLKSNINFFHFNLLDIDELDRKYDIIFCRNVLIYFSTVNKHNVLQGLFNRLNYGGVLFMGKTESIGEFRNKFNIVQIGNTQFYVKDENMKTRINKEALNI